MQNKILPIPGLKFLQIAKMKTRPGRRLLLMTTKASWMTLVSLKTSLLRQLRPRQLLTCRLRLKDLILRYLHTHRRRHNNRTHPHLLLPPRSRTSLLDQTGSNRISPNFLRTCRLLSELRSQSSKSYILRELSQHHPCLQAK